MRRRTLFRSGFTRHLLRSRAILPRPFSSSESLHHAHSAPLGFYSELPVLSDRAHLPPGSVPLRDITCTQPLMREESQPHAMLRPQAFAASRRFAPHARSRAYFIPLPRPGFSSFKDFSLRAATLPHRQEPAPVPFLRAPLARLAPASTAHERRLRGLYPREDAFARTQLFTKFEAASFFEFLSSRSSILALSHRLTQQHPLLTLGPKTFACALVPCPCLQRLLSENFGNYVAALTDLPEFSNLSPKLRFELQPRVAALPSSAT